MALPHAQPLDVIPVRPLGAATLNDARSTALIKTAHLELLHLVLRENASLPEHAVEGECTIHCIEGEVDLAMPTCSRRLQAGELVVLPAGERHAVHARAPSALLVTLRLRDPVPPA